MLIRCSGGVAAPNSKCAFVPTAYKQGYLLLWETGRLPFIFQFRHSSLHSSTLIWYLCHTINKHINRQSASDIFSCRRHLLLKMAEESLLNYGISSLLRPTETTIPMPEEERHPWGSNRFPTFQQPFLRIWDRYSGSQPDNKNRMKSRAPRQRLDTFESRKSSLTIHVNHKD